MSATAVQVNPSSFLPQPTVKTVKPISWEEFQRKYLSREDSFKYEWVGNLVQKTKRGLDRKQLYLKLNLLRAFNQLKIMGELHGELIAGPDLFFLSNHRQPDFAWLTNEQIFRLAEPVAYEVPSFIIEVISDNALVEYVCEKMANYRDAGVQVVWQVFPKLKQVDVYFGRNLATGKVYAGEDICSAAPALPNFNMSVNDIFNNKIV